MYVVREVVEEVFLYDEAQELEHRFLIDFHFYTAVSRSTPRILVCARREAE